MSTGTSGCTRLPTVGMHDSMPSSMTAKAKIAISLAPETLALVDRHAAGRSRSRAIEEELLRALRAREWERLSAQADPESAAADLAWAASGWAEAVDLLAAEQRARPTPRPRARRPR